MSQHTKQNFSISRAGSGATRAMAAGVLTMLACVGAFAADASQGDPVTRAEAALDAWRMDEVGALLGSLPDSVEGDYVRGIAANRANDIDTSKRALQRALPGLERQDPARALDALLTLSDDYQKTSSYADQARTLRVAVARYAGQMEPEALAGVRTVLALASALSDSPPQTVSFSGETRLPIRRNPLGTLDVEARANGVGAHWMLDSGANYSVVSASFAKRLKLEIAGEVSGIGSITGDKVNGQVAIVKELRLGTVTLHNVAVLVFPDEHLHVKLPKVEYQISAALGYPVFQALGRVSFTGDKSVLLGSKPIPATDGAQLYLDGLTPVVTLGVEGAKMPFTLDTGARATALSHTYWTTIQERASGWARSEHEFAGLGGTKTVQKVSQPEWKALVGTDEVVLKDVEVDTQPKSGGDKQPMYGNLGQDLWKNAAGFTLDFQSMRFKIDK